VVQIRVVHKTG